MSKFEIPKEIQEMIEGNCCLITEAEFMKAQKEVVDELPKIPGLACDVSFNVPNQTSN